MSEPTGARRYGTGGGDAYYDAVKYGGYEGTREQFGKDQANFAKNASAVAEAKETVEQDTQEVRDKLNTFDETTLPAALEALQQKGAEQVTAITEKGEEVSQQVETVGTEWKDQVANEGRAKVKAVQDEGDTQVQRVINASDGTVEAVTAEGTKQIDLVGQAGSTQVGNVNSAGSAQIQAIEDKGEETKASIPADYTELTEEVDNLKTAIDYALSPSSWQGIVRTLRSGGTVPRGVEFTVPHAVYGDITFITRRQNVDKVYGDENAQTCTIQPKYLLSVNGGSSAATFQYDRPEAFRKAIEEAIPANSVCTFKNPIAYGSWPIGDYHFTATSEIPVGAMLCISGYQNTALTSLKVNVYADAKATSAIGSYDIAEGVGDATVDLGEWTNHPQIISYGSNNEAESGIFQWLNGITGENYMDSIWKPKTKYDMMNNSFTSLKGFLGGFPEEFQNVLQPCIIHNITNNVFEAQDSAYQVNQAYTHVGKFWLPSRKEIYGTNETANEADETQFPYYAEIGTTDADKLMYAQGATVATSYWLRTPHASFAYRVRLCTASGGGALDSGGASSSYGVTPLAILA